MIPKKAIPLVLALFVVFTFSSCSCLYFNTIHNIKKNFHGAERSRDKEGRDEARGSEIQQYNTTITKASRVLERHPNSDWVDDCLYYIGTSYYHLGEFDKSTRKFQELFANYPESRFVPESRLMYAKAKMEIEDETEAIVLFEEIFQDDPSRERKTEAARSLGQFYFKINDYETANIYFKSLIDSLGNQTDRLRALTFMGDGYFDRFQFDSAFQKYQEALDNNPDTLQFYSIVTRMAECDFYRNRFNDGVERLQDMAGDDLYYDSLHAIRLMMAEGYEWDYDLESAIATYEEIIKNNPGTDAAAIAYYRLGLIYQYDIEDYEKAREAYQDARNEKKTAPINEDATRRASRLTLLAQYQQAEGADTLADTVEVEQQVIDEIAENQFLLGELFYFDLEKPDSAMQTFSGMIDDYPQSKFAPQGIISLAYIYRNEYGDTAASDSLMRVLLKRYGTRDEAKLAIDELGLSGTVADSGYAAVTFARAEAYREQFETLDSTRYYMSMVVDSLKAVYDSIRVVRDSIRALEDSLAVVDSLEEESSTDGKDSGDLESADLELGADTAQVSDTGTVKDDDEPRADTILVLDTLWTVDSIWTILNEDRIDSMLAADTTIETDRRWRLDSLWAFDSTAWMDTVMVLDSIWTKDSVWAKDTTYRLDSIEVRPGQWQVDSLITTTTVRRLDSTLSVDSTREEVDFLEIDSLLTLDSTIVTDTTYLVDSTWIVDTIVQATDSMWILDSIWAIDSTWILDSLIETTFIWTVDTTGEADALTLDSTLVVDSSYRADSVLVLDSSLTVDSTWMALADMPPDSVLSLDSLLVLDSLWMTAEQLAADTAQQVTLSFTDYWEAALDSAREKYNQTQYAMLDTAQLFYRYIMDNFPYSRYRVKSQYVLLQLYDTYLAPGDSSLIEMYKTFVDSFPTSEYALAIGDEYNIRPSSAIQRQIQQEQQRQQPQQQEQEGAAEDDSVQEDAADDPFAADSLDFVTSTISKFIIRENDTLLPAREYFRAEEIPFEYPIECLAYGNTTYGLEGDFYFQVRIDFTGEVADYQYMNPSECPELNEHLDEVIKNTKFDPGKIETQYYDSWFYYVKEVRVPSELRR